MNYQQDHEDFIYNAYYQQELGIEAAFFPEEDESEAFECQIIERPQGFDNCQYWR